MVQSLTSTRQRAPQQNPRAPLSILRTETVLSRFPIHTLTKRGRVAIHIKRTNAQGALDLRWDVSYNDHYGPPRQLAYKLDTIVINQILDTLPRPLPRVLPLGSMTHVCGMLDLHASGRQQAELKNAFHQNASAYIVAYLRYRGRDGMERTINTGFTRYSVIFTGESLPDGTIADAVYLVLSDIYLDILNHSPVRPLNYAYLKALTPTAQRLYEILSYKMFAALKHRHAYATLRYTEYCLLSTQQRYTEYDRVKKQMFKVHQPHVQSGYITKVHYEATTDADGQPDWCLHYTPGPKAQAEYAVFMRQPDAEALSTFTLPTEAEQDDLLALVTPEVPAVSPRLLPRLVRRSRAVPEVRPPEAPAASGPEATALASPAPAAMDTAEPPHPQAATLVQQFYQRFHGLAGVTPSAKEVEQAGEILATHGEATADFFLTYAHTAARETQYQPQVFGGILHYLPRALAAYATRTSQATHATARQQEEAERVQHEQYVQWRQQALAAQRAALPAEALAALEAAQQARLVAEGTAPVALRLAVRLAVDAGLEAQAGLPDFAAWRQAQPAQPLDEGGGRGTPGPRGA